MAEKIASKYNWTFHFKLVKGYNNATGIKIIWPQIFCYKNVKLFSENVVCDVIKIYLNPSF